MVDSIDVAELEINVDGEQAFDDFDLNGRDVGAPSVKQRIETTANVKHTQRNAKKRTKCLAHACFCQHL